MLFTTSWDDGRKDDLKLAALLEAYGATGTFYVCPPDAHEKMPLTKVEIKRLSERHEIGAHSITHPRLTRLSREDARREITDSKTWIEEITGTPCSMFCYPYGDENAAMRELAQEAGFSGARTVEQLKFSGDDPFGLPTTLQIYPFPFRRKFTRWWHPLDPVARLRVYFPELLKLGVPVSAYTGWLSLAKALYLYAERTNQPFFHLWGHSWEIEKYGMWGQLEKFLKFVSERNGVTYTANSGLL